MSHHGPKFSTTMIHLGGGFHFFLTLKISILTSIFFQMGWFNHLPSESRPQSLATISASVPDHEMEEDEPWPTMKTWPPNLMGS